MEISNTLFILLVSYPVFSVGRVSHDFFADNLSNNLNGASCDRECDGVNMDCYYDLDIESYSTMSKACYLCPHVLEDCYRPHCVPGNGLKRLILTANRQMPGEQIRVCEGDTVIVNVTNNMYNFESTTMHWHGLHQADTNYMDGVGLLTQCGIQAGSKWTYRFFADPPGTHWYHSHTGAQRGDGLYGAVIVKETENKMADLYDYDMPEHVLILSDWERTPSVVKAVLHEQSKENNKPEYLLINGAGAGDLVAKPSWYGEEDWVAKTTPHYRLTMEPGLKYRLRVISNAMLNCPIELFIQDHNFTVIASDGAQIEPTYADVVVLGGGERWDIIVTADKPVANYWLYIRGIADCAPGGNHIQQTAIISYTGADPTALPTGELDATTVRSSSNDWVVMNPFNDGLLNTSTSDNQISLPELASVDNTYSDWIEAEPDHKFYLGLDLHWVDNDHTNNVEYYSQESQLDLGGRSVIAQVNRISGVLPAAPYLSQYDQISESEFCTYDSSSHNYVPEDCETKGCHCIHRIKVQTDDIVEMILIDEGKPFNGSNHAMHLHGMYWTVLAVGQDPSRLLHRSDVIEMDTAGEIVRNFSNPIYKDTIMLPDGGYVVTKFKADNPGVWFMHCHNEVHATQGMNIIIEVGDVDEWPVLENLPRCGPYHYRDEPQSVKDSKALTVSVSSGLVFVMVAFLFIE